MSVDNLDIEWFCVPQYMSASASVVDENGEQVCVCETKEIAKRIAKEHNELLQSAQLQSTLK